MQPIVIRNSRSLLLTYGCLSALITLISAVVALFAAISWADRCLYWSTTLAFSILTTLPIRHLLDRPILLKLDDRGFSAPNLVGLTIPWQAVSRVRLRTRTLLVDLKPADADALLRHTGRRMTRKLEHLIDTCQYSVNLVAVKDADRVFKRFQACTKTAS